MHTIIRVLARDYNESQNSDLKYAFFHNEDKVKFSIDAGTGIIAAK